MKENVLIFTICLFTTVLYGQNNPKTILWKVTKPGSENESFLFGTFHEVSPSFFSSLTKAVNELENSDILFVERSMALAQKDTASKSSLWGVGKWNSILSDEQQDVFSEFVNKIENTNYYNYSPLMLSLEAVRLYFMYFCEADVPEELMDTYIEKQAIEQGKKVYSLDVSHQQVLNDAAESFSFTQDSLYASISIRYMKSMLEEDLTSCEYINSYKNFEIDYELDKGGNQGSDPLLMGRNMKWIKTLDKVLPTNNCFVAVGLRHLFFKQGLIQQLRGLGYEVTPVPIEKEL